MLLGIGKASAGFPYAWTCTIFSVLDLRRNMLPLLQTGLHADHVAGGQHGEACLCRLQRRPVGGRLGTVSRPPPPGVGSSRRQHHCDGWESLVDEMLGPVRPR